MDSFLPVLSLLLLSAAVSHASLPAQIYWHSVLPNTHMPDAIRDLLRRVNVGKGGVNVHTGYQKSGGGTDVNVGQSGVNVNTKPGTNVNVGHRGVNVHTGYKKPGGGTNVNVGHGGVNVHTGYKKPGGGTNVNVGLVTAGPPSVAFQYAATETQIQDDPNVTLFFLEKDLHAGAKMNLHFTRSSGASTFLPRRVADSLPFSSEKMPEILSRFSIEPNSEKAEAMSETIKVCEEPAAEGEQKVCATSLESMVDFSTASLGTRDLRAESTTAGQGAEIEQEYTVAPAGVQKMAGSELVACHLEAYAYAVFFCHSTEKTTAYSVEMVGENGAKVEAVAVCHADTAGWNPGHAAFKVLKVKPGTVPVCHFVPEEHVVWAHSN